MKRHYAAKKLRFTLDPKELARYEEDFWNLPPYLIGRFGGELSRVMLEAAQQYIFDQTLGAAQSRFDAAAFPDKKPPHQEFSDTSRNDTT